MSSSAGQSPREAARAFTPELSSLIDNPLFSDVWTDPRLSPRDRSLATVAALVVLYRPDELPAHLARAIENGVTPDEISALITHVAFYGGFPASISASAIAHRVLDGGAQRDPQSEGAEGPHGTTHAVVVDPQILLLVSYDVDPRDHEAFERILGPHASASHTYPGCLRFSVTRSMGTPGTYVLIEQWTDRASLDAHVASSAFVHTREALESSCRVLSVERTILETPGA